MTPADLGLRMPSWRPRQLDAVLEIASGWPGVVAHNGPTGSGKSLTALGAATLNGGRFAYLVTTKALQDQIGRDFPLADMRGQANYLCDLELPGLKLTTDKAVCRFGVPCALKGAGCAYFAAYRKAAQENLVTNYRCWLAAGSKGLGFGSFQTLVLDEAHTIPDELSAYYTMELEDWVFDAYLPKDLGRRMRDGELSPGLLPDLRAAEEKVAAAYADVLVELGKRRKRDTLVRLKELQRIADTLKNMKSAAYEPENWILQPGGDYDPFRIVPTSVSIAPLIGGVPNVLLTSATMTPKTISMMGLQGVHWTASVPAYPKEQRPVHLVSTVRMRHDMPPGDLDTMITRIDQAIRPRLGSKGIIHTGSYALAKTIAERSFFKAYFVTHDRRNTAARVAAFKDMKAPAILISPSVTTGYDFPGEECEWQIIAKVSWPNPTDPVVAARTKLDRAYAGHQAMQTLVQTCGRGVRRPDDFCETIVLDDSARFLVDRYKSSAPLWFHDAVEVSAALPRWER